jgi:zinc D-Ala-D-Ala dipeptidase
MRLGLVLILLFTVHSCFAQQATKDSLFLPQAKNKWSRLSPRSAKKVLLRMAYASEKNFMHQKIYPCAKCYLRPEAMRALDLAIDSAAKRGYKLVLYDCYRPKKFQQLMYDLVKNDKYVANPAKGSMHNRGLAVDIGLADSAGNILDCGSSFDDFSDKAHFSYSKCSAMAIANKKTLRNIMLWAGFKPYDNEWWHFGYAAVHYEVDDFVWPCN